MVTRALVSGSASSSSASPVSIIARIARWMTSRRAPHTPPWLSANCSSWSNAAAPGTNSSDAAFRMPMRNRALSPSAAIMPIDSGELTSACRYVGASL